ncbi:MAG TPA: ABC transporter permease [Candidatus Thermoplasmatota archaeon]|nr:ABC transporter permease [Candidatus Thermoplasmatota archaeon]
MEVASGIYARGAFMAHLQKDWFHLKRDWLSIVLAVLTPFLSIGVYKLMGPAESQAGVNPTAFTLCLSITFSSIIMSATSVVKEKMGGTLKRLAKSPANLTSFLAAKMVVAFGVVVVQALIVLVATDLLIQGLGSLDVPAFIVTMLLLGMMCHAVGLFISCVCTTDVQAVLTSALLMSQMISLSGVLRPLDRLGALGEVARVLPLTQAYHAMKDVMDNGLALNLAHAGMVATVAVLFAGAVVALRFSKFE